MTDDPIIIPFEHHLNHMAGQVADKLADLCRAVPFDQTGEREIITFLRSQAEICHQFFEGAPNG